MFSRICRHGALSVCGLVLLAGVSASAANTDALSGQWKGQSRLDDEKGTAATSLAISNGEGRLRIDGTPRCAINGAVEPASDGGCWHLKPSDARGGAMCDAMSKGELTVCVGEGRVVKLEARYSRDGREQKRLGTLGHYP